MQRLLFGGILMGADTWISLHAKPPCLATFFSALLHALCCLFDLIRLSNKEDPNISGTENVAAVSEGLINNLDSRRLFKLVSAQQHGAFFSIKKIVGGLCLASLDKCLNTFPVQFFMAGSQNVDALYLWGECQTPSLKKR